MNKFVLMFAAFFFMATQIYAQQIITGTIKDGSGSLPGATVLVKGTSVAAMSDGEGKYTIEVSEGSSFLVFSFIGMETQEVEITSDVINVVMKMSDMSLDEIVVVGYGVQKKRDITGSVSTINSKVISDQPVSDAATMLQGRAAGVMVTQTSGAPGSGISVRIRGTGTVNSAGPLYVVDGILLDNISHLNSSDIERMEVLKDASATAIYGSRGANGVVLITTRKGDSKNVRVQVEQMYGVKEVWKKPDLMNSEDWLNIYNTSQANANTHTGSSAYEALELTEPSNNTNNTTNWFDEITRTGRIFKTNATISRGDENSNTLFSVGYFNDEGVFNNSSYDKINARLNTNYTVSSIIKTGVNISLSNTATNSFSSSAISGIVTLSQRLDPLTPVKDASGNWVSTPYSDLGNPVAQAERDIYENDALLILANPYLQIEPMKNLVFRTAFNLNISRSNSKRYYPAYEYTGGENRLTNSLSKSSNEYNGWLTENTLTYTLENSGHNLSMMLGFTAEKGIYESLSASRNNIPGDADVLQYLDASTDIESTDAGNTGTDIRMYSYLGRLNYNFANRYFLTTTFRQDGSSVFGPNERFAGFPSVSLGWKLENEDFMNFLPKNIVNRFMIRAGWGQVGNAKIDPYGFASSMQSGDSKVEYSYIFSGEEYAGLAPVKMANLDMRWETVESTNIGVDLAFLKDKINFTADYFVKETKEMLVEIPMPEYAGYDGAPYVNAGEVRNKGFEISISYNGNVGNDVKYSIGVNATHIKNEVIDLGGGNPIWGGSASLIGNTTRTVEGQPIGAFYGYEMDGVFQTQEEVDASAQSGEGIGAGDFRFVDQWTDIDEDGVLEEPDGVINSDDRVYLGSPVPDLYYGLNFDLSYKGFDLSLFFQGLYGNEVFNAFKYYNYNVTKRYALSSDYSDYWTEQNASNTMFGLNSATIDKNLRTSDFYIENGSYFRLKNLQIGYTFNNVPNWLSSVRLYFSGQNLLTLTDYSGLDPEIGGGSLSQGVDYGTYPQSRIYSFGLNINF